MAIFEIRDLIVSLSADSCNATKKILATHLFVCDGSNGIGCIGYATKGELPYLKEQLICALCAVQEREGELREDGGGRFKPATNEELEILETRLQATLEKVRSQKRAHP
jgi:hypothetical protein